MKGEIAQIASGQIDNRLFESAPQAVKDRILESEQARNQEKEEVEKGQAQPDPLEAPERANAEPPGPQLEKPEDADEQENHDVKGEAPASLVKTGDKEPVSDQVAGDDPANAAEANNSTATVTATLDSVDTEQDSGEGKDEDLEDEAEAEEEEKSPKKRSRATTAARKGDAPSRLKVSGTSWLIQNAVLAGSRTTKRKASEPTPPAADSPASIEPESAAPASKRAKRGARKSRGDTEAEQEARDPPGPLHSVSLAVEPKSVTLTLHRDTTETKESKQMAVRRRTAYTRIIETIRTSLPFSSSFDSKVTKSQAPNYSAAVQRPTCLRDIAKKIKNGEIKDNSELMREFAIMCANAVQFNGVEGEVSVGRQAQELWEAFERQVDISSTTLPPQTEH